MRRLWNDFKLPMFALVDADPHGQKKIYVLKIVSWFLFFSLYKLC